MRFGSERKRRTLYHFAVGRTRRAGVLEGERDFGFRLHHESSTLVAFNVAANYSVFAARSNLNRSVRRNAVTLVYRFYYVRARRGVMVMQGRTETRHVARGINIMRCAVGGYTHAERRSSAFGRNLYAFELVGYEFDYNAVSKLSVLTLHKNNSVFARVVVCVKVHGFFSRADVALRRIIISDACPAVKRRNVARRAFCIDNRLNTRVNVVGIRSLDYGGYIVKLEALRKVFRPAGKHVYLVNRFGITHVTAEINVF